MHVHRPVGTWATNDLTAADTEKPTHWTFFDRGLEETVVAVLVSPPVGPPLLSGVGDICGFRHDSLDEPPTRGMFEHPLCNATSKHRLRGARADAICARRQRRRGQARRVLHGQRRHVGRNSFPSP